MKHFFLSLFSLLLLAAVLPARDKAPAVAVVVDPATYQAIRADVDAFTASMTLVGKEGILVIDRWDIRTPCGPNSAVSMHMTDWKGPCSSVRFPFRWSATRTT